MKLHRNSQKRFYGKDYCYFVTGVTQNRASYFEEEIFCEVFYENLKVCQELKGFELHGWFLGYDHFHMLMTPGDEWNVSEIIHNLKRVTSLQINQIIEGEDIYPRLRWDNRLLDWRSRFIQKYPNPYIISYPKFKWLKSFHDHVIRNEHDFDNHMRYIQKNPLKHDMPDGWRWIGFGTNEREVI